MERFPDLAVVSVGRPAQEAPTTLATGETRALH